MLLVTASFAARAPFAIYYTSCYALFFVVTQMPRRYGGCAAARHVFTFIVAIPMLLRCQMRDMVPRMLLPILRPVAAAIEALLLCYAVCASAARGRLILWLARECHCYAFQLSMPRLMTSMLMMPRSVFAAIVFRLPLATKRYYAATTFLPIYATFR